MPTPEQDAQYIGRIAHEAASGMLGFAPPTDSDLVDAIVLEAIAFAGFQFTRARQMATQYYWLYELTGPFSWKGRG